MKIHKLYAKPNKYFKKKKKTTTVNAKDIYKQYFLLTRVAKHQFLNVLAYTVKPSNMIVH